MGRGSGELRTGGEKWFGSPVSSVRGIWIRGGWVGGRIVKLNGMGGGSLRMIANFVCDVYKK